MVARSKTQIAADEERARNRMLAAEGALLLLLLRRVRPFAVEAESPIWTPESLRDGVARDIIAGRRASAAASLDDLEKVMLSLGLPLVGSPLSWGDEVRRAERAAHGLATGLQRHVELARATGVEDLVDDAAGWLHRRSELTAATEEALEATIEAHPELAEQLFKQWDAELDEGTCDVCGYAHGTIVLATEDFPEGTPGHVHPRCRCQEHLLTLDEARARPGWEG